jgi:membrane associated rhomboid family serine protease
MDEYLGYQLKEFGMKPRVTEGLRGIITIHFLHADLDHIVQNSLALFVLNSFVFYFYRSIALPVFAALFFLSPILLWFTGREGNHIGASVLIYAEFVWRWWLYFTTVHSYGMCFRSTKRFPGKDMPVVFSWECWLRSGGENKGRRERYISMKLNPK